MGWLLAFAALGAAAFVAFRDAPEGYQDEDGFHYGRDPHLERQCLELTGSRAQREPGVRQ